MNLPVNETELQTRQKIHFHQSYMYVCRTKIKMHRGEGPDFTEHFVVLIEESNATLRGHCYRTVWRHINSNEQLRVLLTGFESEISLAQVVDMAGYGIFTCTPPRIGNHVCLTYHPRTNGKIQAVGIVLGTCELGPVVRPPQPPSNNQKAP